MKTQTEQTEKKCQDKVESAAKSRMADIRAMFEAEDQTVEDIGCLFDYGLGIDLVPAGTFNDQRENYIRYQLSWGGPSEEFRLYENGEIEFWYLDWFDGAPVVVEGDDADMIKEIIEMSGIEFHKYE